MHVDEADTIVGTIVRDRHGRDVGSVEDIVIDRATGRVSFAVVSVRDARRSAAEEMLPVPWNALSRSSTGGPGLDLSVGRAAVDRAPTVERDELGELQRRDIVVEVFSHYGVQPPWHGSQKAGASPGRRGS